MNLFLSYLSSLRRPAPHLKSRGHFVAQLVCGSSSEGFTLIEMAVVAAIIGLMSVSLIINFSRTRVDIDQSANLVMATIREAQSRAVSSVSYAGYNPCGYGVHYVSSTQIAIYVGPNAAGDCAIVDVNKNYTSAKNALLPSQSFSDSKIQFKNSFADIYFQPPDPKTYLDNNASLNQGPISIQVGVVGVACPQNCRTIAVYPSGKIETQ